MILVVGMVTSAAALWHERKRAGDAVALSGYIGNDSEFDKAIAEFAIACSDHTERDWRTFLDAIKAGRSSDDMFAAAARALAGVSPALRDPKASLLPTVQDLRSVAVTVAAAIASQARAEGPCQPFDDTALNGLIAQKMCEPLCRPYCRKRKDAHG